MNPHTVAHTLKLSHLANLTFRLFHRCVIRQSYYWDSHSTNRTIKQKRRLGTDNLISNTMFVSVMTGVISNRLILHILLLKCFLLAYEGKEFSEFIVTYLRFHSFTISQSVRNLTQKKYDLTILLASKNRSWLRISVWMTDGGDCLR
jgi:hypothetical protein